MSTVLTECDERGVHTLTLNQPGRFNVLDEDTLRALTDAVAVVQADPQARVLVLAAAGKAFCAGHDLKQMAVRPDQAYYEDLFARCSRLMLALRAELRGRGAYADGSEPNLTELLDLVALGTVADLVKLDDNNRILVEQGFTLVATGGTAEYLAANGVPVERVNKVAQGRPHIVDRIRDAIGAGDFAELRDEFLGRYYGS